MRIGLIPLHCDSPSDVCRQLLSLLSAFSSAKHSQILYPFLIGHDLQTAHHLGDSSLNLLQFVYVCYKLGCPELDPVFQMRSD
ncbi:hypothetical protein GDO78_021684 [Eleutherodactylus coqui]|uniref:Uncharacterized protein n=1 Tax=Eleutherodactylus coqui TaxID=57060 RepID=A0A8J6B8U6_ELECQ|nr:hypothetical protein GDO78_021684 [Eleutherodactylus coqui]